MIPMDLYRRPGIRMGMQGLNDEQWMTTLLKLMY